MSSSGSRLLRPILALYATVGELITGLHSQLMMITSSCSDESQDRWQQRAAVLLPLPARGLNVLLYRRFLHRDCCTNNICTLLLFAGPAYLLVCGTSSEMSGGAAGIFEGKLYLLLTPRVDLGQRITTINTHV